MQENKIHDEKDEPICLELENVYKDFVQQLSRKIRRVYNIQDIRNKIFVGGIAEIVKEHLKEEFPGAIIGNKFTNLESMKLE